MRLFKIVFVFLGILSITNGCSKKETDAHDIITSVLSSDFSDKSKVLLYLGNGEIKSDFLKNKCLGKKVLSTDNVKRVKERDGINLTDHFSFDDIDRMCSQLTYDLKIDKQKLPSQIQVISDDYLNKQEYEGLFTKYHIISNPVFSTDGQYALIYRSVYCGIECGDGRLELYKKAERGKWGLILSESIWIS